MDENLRKLLIELEAIEQRIVMTETSTDGYDKQLHEELVKQSQSIVGRICGIVRDWGN